MNVNRVTMVILSLLATVCVAADRDASADTRQAPESPQREEVYIPSDLEDCFRELDRLLKPGDVEKIRKGEVTPVDMHFGLGMGLRNRWGLWGGSRLAAYFNGLGIHHPEDMSGIILDSYVHHLKNEPIGLPEQIAYYKKFWDDRKKQEEKTGEPSATDNPDGAK